MPSGSSSARPCPYQLESPASRELGLHEKAPNFEREPSLYEVHPFKPHATLTQTQTKTDATAQAKVVVVSSCRRVVVSSCWFVRFVRLVRLVRLVRFVWFVWFVWFVGCCLLVVVCCCLFRTRTFRRSLGQQLLGINFATSKRDSEQVSSPKNSSPPPAAASRLHPFITNVSSMMKTSCTHTPKLQLNLIVDTKTTRTNARANCRESKAQAFINAEPHPSSSSMNCTLSKNCTWWNHQTLRKCNCGTSPVFCTVRNDQHGSHTQPPTPPLHLLNEENASHCRRLHRRPAAPLRRPRAPTPRTPR